MRDNGVGSEIAIASKIGLAYGLSPVLEPHPLCNITVLCSWNSCYPFMLVIAAFSDQEIDQTKRRLAVKFQRQRLNLTIESPSLYERQTWAPVGNWSYTTALSSKLTDSEELLLTAY